MKRLARLLALLLLCLGAWERPGEAAGTTILVIANAGVPASSLSVETLADIYSRRIMVWPNGTPIVPVNREAGSRERLDFSMRVFGRPPEALADYWSRMHFQGVNPPLVLESDAAVVAFVREVPGAIGYVGKGTPLAGTKILKHLSP